MIWCEIRAYNYVSMDRKYTLEYVRVKKGFVTIVACGWHAQR